VSYPEACIGMHVRFCKTGCAWRSVLPTSDSDVQYHMILSLVRTSRVNRTKLSQG